MSGTTTTGKDVFGLAGGLRHVPIEHNKVIDDLEKLRAGGGALIGSAVYDPPSLGDGVGTTTTVTVTGAALGGFVISVSFSLDTQGIILYPWISATDTVSVRFQNETGGTIDLASGTLRCRVSPLGTFSGAASDMTAAKIGNDQGVAITA